MSDDGTQGLTLIGFVGSVFSPYYAWARRHGRGDPLNHCAFNVALYGARAARWAMTERGSAQVERGPAHLSIGPSVMRWTGEALQIDLNEVCAPLPRRLRGRVRLIPSAMNERSFALDDTGIHLWTPYSPQARVEVTFDEPRISWTGGGYFDSNAGGGALEDTFESWTWSRAGLPESTVVLYDTQPRNAAPRCLALHFAQDGSVRDIEPPPAAALARTGWLLPRNTRADRGQAVGILETFEDAPFYSRSLLDTHLLGTRTKAVHESLSLDRFRARWVHCLLPFRMPRITF